jgi:hypothetical protein
LVNLTGREPDLLAVYGLYCFQHETVFLRQQLGRDVNPEVGVDSDEMRIESGVMNLR